MVNHKQINDLVMFNCFLSAIFYLHIRKQVEY